MTRHDINNDIGATWRQRNRRATIFSRSRSSPSDRNRIFFRISSRADGQTNKQQQRRTSTKCGSLISHKTIIFIDFFSYFRDWMKKSESTSRNGKLVPVAEALPSLSWQLFWFDLDLTGNFASRGARHISSRQFYISKSLVLYDATVPKSSQIRSLLIFSFSVGRLRVNRKIASAFHECISIITAPPSPNWSGSRIVKHQRDIVAEPVCMQPWPYRFFEWENES